MSVEDYGRNLLAEVHEAPFGQVWSSVLRKGLEIWITPTEIRHFYSSYMRCIRRIGLPRPNALGSQLWIVSSPSLPTLLPHCHHRPPTPWLRRLLLLNAHHRPQVVDMLRSWYWRLLPWSPARDARSFRTTLPRTQSYQRSLLARGCRAGKVPWSISIRMPAFPFSVCTGFFRRFSMLTLLHQALLPIWMPRN